MKIMSRLWKAPAIALLGLMTLAPVAQATPPAGNVVVVRGFYGGGFYGPGWWGWGPGWYGYYGWGPGYGPYAFAGTVKIKTKFKDNQVFVDGGYAGLTGKLKKFALRPGNHTIEVRDSDGRIVYQERVQVIAGRTVEIHPDRPAA